MARIDELTNPGWTPHRWHEELLRKASCMDTYHPTIAVELRAKAAELKALIDAQDAETADYIRSIGGTAPGA